MAVPTATRIGSTFSKSTTTTSVILSPSPNSFALNDIILLIIACDPNVVIGAKTFTGTATLGTWNDAEIDITNGSGTSGVRLIFQWARVTGAGTLTSVTIANTLGGAARFVLGYNVSGTDTTTPINGKASSNAGGNTVTLTNSGRDCVALACQAVENAGLVADNMAQWSGWTAVAVDTTTVGTTGSTAATNVCEAIANASQTNVTSNPTGPVGTSPTGTRTYGYIVFEAPAAGASGGFEGWGIPI